MSAPTVASLSATVWAVINVPPFGVMVGVATFGSALTVTVTCLVALPETLLAVRV